jgi:hypothetical protein
MEAALERVAQDRGSVGAGEGKREFTLPAAVPLKEELHNEVVRVKNALFRRFSRGRRCRTWRGLSANFPAME